MLPCAEECENILGRTWRLKYNRMYNRRFDSSKMDSLSGGRMAYIPIEDGLRKCICRFVENGCSCGSLSPLSEAYMDRIAHTHTGLGEFRGYRKKAVYLVARYTPYIALRKKAGR